jgi:hypothetical protein
MADSTLNEPIPSPLGVVPLSELPEEQRRRIEEQVARRGPPGRWLGLAFAQIPNRAWYEWHWARGIDPDRGAP